MAETLALRYRPRTLDDLSGQDHVATVLAAEVKEHRASGTSTSTWIFTGPPGTGKTSTARMLAAAYNSADGYDWAPTAIREVDAATNNGVDDVRELVQAAQYAVLGRHRTFLVDECHALSDAAWQALLKELEDPAPNTTWILVTTEAAKVPDAVLSRAIPLVFRAIDSDAVLRRLVAICQAEGIGAEIEALELVAARAAGGMRDAIMGLEQLRLAGQVTVETYTAVFGVGRAAHSYLAAVATGDLPGAMAIARAYAAGTGDAGLLVDECLELLSDRLASGQDARVNVAATRQLWTARHRLRANPLGARAALGAVTAELATAFQAPLGAHTQKQSPAATAEQLGAALGNNVR